DPSLEVPRQRQLLLIVLLLRFVRLAALVNVDAAPDEARERSRVVGKGHAAIDNPAGDTVVAAQAVLHFERFVTAKVVEIQGHAALEIVRVHTLGPAIPHFLLERPPREGEPGLVEIVALRVEAGAP